jgi:hypothetical protein
MRYNELNRPAAVPAFSRSRHVSALSRYIRDREACSACFAGLVQALRRLEAEGRLQTLRDIVAVGQGYKGETGMLGMGRCTRGFQASVPGCPPTAAAAYAFLRDFT